MAEVDGNYAKIMVESMACFVANCRHFVPISDQQPSSTVRPDTFTARLAGRMSVFQLEQTYNSFCNPFEHLLNHRFLDLSG
jgi:hypothetical protein